jgi:hypothetical protein
MSQPSRSRYFRLWASDLMPTMANPPTGYKSVNRAEVGGRWFAEDEEGALESLRDGTVVLALVVG